VGEGVWQVHLGVGVGVAVAVAAVPGWPLTAAEMLMLVWVADRVVACAAVPVTVSMNAATPKAKQLASTRARMAISAPPRWIAAYRSYRSN
jgi:hypothetical protein